MYTAKSPLTHISKVNTFSEHLNFSAKIRAHNAVKNSGHVKTDLKIINHLALMDIQSKYKYTYTFCPYICI